MMRVLGAVLAGGRSSRFGSDKAIALVDGLPLLNHAIRSLRHVTPDVVICGREWPGVTSLDDRPAAGMGPLGGLNAALRHGRSNGFQWVLSLACDTPFIETGVLSDLVARQAACFVEGHPVIGLWPTRACEVLDRFLATDERHSLRNFASAISAQAHRVPGEIANFNRPQDLQKWLAGSKKPG